MSDILITLALLFNVQMWHVIYVKNT